MELGWSCPELEQRVQIIYKEIVAEGTSEADCLLKLLPLLDETELDTETGDG